MAIDKNKARDLMRSVLELGDTLLGSLPHEVKDVIINNVFGSAYKELDRLINDSRPPRLFLVGRSGHGKSSLVNALARKKVADTDDVKPCTTGSCVYEIVFKESYSSWSVVDTRGIFETIDKSEKSNKAEIDPVETLAADIIAYKPDVIIHVANAVEARNLKEDIRLITRAMNVVTDKLRVRIPAITVLTKVDTLGNPREWPPEDYPRKAGHIRESIDYMATNILGLEGKPIDRNLPIKGIITGDEHTIAVIPVSCLEGELWNMNLLYDFIGNMLPEEAHLDYFQAQKRRASLKTISSSLIRRFSSIAALVGLVPIPVADIFVLTPLQLLMIAVICGLSCRELSMKTVAEYIAAMGINIGYAVTLRAIAGELVKLLPVAGSVISAAIAASGTYTLGKSAEAYFFSDEKKNPASFKKEWKREEKEILAIEDKTRKRR